MKPHRVVKPKNMTLLPITTLGVYNNIGIRLLDLIIRHSLSHHCASHGPTLSHIVSMHRELTLSTSTPLFLSHTHIWSSMKGCFLHLINPFKMLLVNKILATLQETILFIEFQWVMMGFPCIQLVTIGPQHEKANPRGMWS